MKLDYEQRVRANELYEQMVEDDDTLEAIAFEVIGLRDLNAKMRSMLKIVDEETSKDDGGIRIYEQAGFDHLGFIDGLCEIFPDKAASGDKEDNDGESV